MKKIFFILIQLFMLNTLSAKVAIIAHKDNTNVGITENEVSRIYLGKLKTFPDGTNVIPIDLASGDAKKHFYAKVVRKNDAQLRAYWSRIIFTGKGQPPRQEDSESSVLNLVSSNPNLLGYVDSTKATDDVSVLLTV